MTPSAVHPETCNNGYCASQAWISTVPGKLPNLFPFTEDNIVAAYPLIYFRGFILPFTIAVHILCGVCVLWSPDQDGTVHGTSLWNQFNMIEQWDLTSMLNTYTSRHIIIF